MLKRVHFAGIKSLLDVTVDLEPFTVLVGPNGCGKSTLLDQIELVTVASTADRGSNNTFGIAGEAIEASSLGEISTAGRAVETEWEAEDVGGRRILIRIAPGNPVTWYERLRLLATNGEGSSVLNFESKKGDQRDFAQNLAQHFSWRAQRLALSPAAISYPSPVQSTDLRSDGFGLPTLLKDLSGNDTGAFLRLKEDLQKVVPHFRDIRFGKGNSKEGPTNTLELIMQQGRVPAHRVSDGTLIALALLTATHNPDLPRLILMDDIDHGLHLSAQIEMIDAIRRVMAQRPDLQVICTTHSPVLLDRFAIHEVRVMALDGQGYTRVKPLAQHPELDAWRAGMGTGELWANLGEAWVIDG